MNRLIDPGPETLDAEGVVVPAERPASETMTAGHGDLHAQLAQQRVVFFAHVHAVDAHAMARADKLLGGHGCKAPAIHR